MNKAIFVLLAALAYGASAGEVLSGDAAKAKFPAAVQAMQLSETKWSQLMTGVEYGFTHTADMYGVPDDLHVLKIDYANAPVKMKILEHSPNKMRTSEAAAAANALFAINGTMYNTSVGKPIYNHKVDGRVVTPESGNLPTKVQGLAFNPDKSFDFSGTATLTFADWDNIISCDCLLSKGVNMMDSPEFAWAKNTPGAGYPLIGMTPEKVLVILVIDGRRTGISQGINYFNSAELLKEFGCTEGILYDGGGSTTLAMRNDIVPATDFARTQVVPDYCDGYTLMNYVNTKNNVWEERAVIDQIAFVADDTPTVRNEFRVTPYVQHPATNAITLKFLTTTNTAATISWWPQDNAGAAQSATVSPRHAEELQYYGDHHTLQYLPEMTPWQYRYRIEGLQPDTVYEYKVELTGGASYAKHFRTAPAANRPIRFVCYSDCETEPGSNGSAVTWDNFIQDQDANPSATSRKYFVDQTVGYASNICTMVSRQPDFFVIAGDLAQTGSCQTHWDEFWRHNAGALNDPAGSIPILAALGNHEYSSYTANAGGSVQPGEQGALKFLSYFEFEPNGAAVDADQQQRFHRVDYGPVALIFIDPNNGPDNEPPAGTPWSWGWEYAHPHERDTNAQLYEHRIDGGVDKSSRVPQFQEGSAQYQWLEEQLADAQTNKLFTFLVCHQCPFSAGYHGRASGELGRGVEDENLSGVPTRCLTNLVFKYGVDGWICGHDEMYEHSQVQGEETLPDGTKRPMTLNVWDVGIGGDGLRGCRITTEPNPYEVFRAHKDAPEVYDNGDWQTGTLVSGGKHYGHLEVNVDQNEEGQWTATLTPVYNFVSKNAQTGALTFERRTYPDEVVITNFTSVVPVEIDETKIYVSPTGDGTSPHAGFATGYASINDALAAANAGDTVILDKTTFVMTNSFTISKAITFCGAGENWETVIDGQNNGRTFTISAEGAFVHSFTFMRMGGQYSASLGLTMNKASVVSNVVARQNGNKWTSGNARYPLNVSAGLVTHCWITNNYACNNAGIKLSKATMENCYIADNRCRSTSGTGPGGEPGIVVLGDQAVMRNCTIVNNKSKDFVVRYNNTNAKVYNNIIWNNTFLTTDDDNNVSLSSASMSTANWKGNCTRPLTGSAADGNIAVDPLLQDDQKHFYSSSPCNHKAVAEHAATYDIEGQERGENPSMGAFEYVASGNLSCLVVATATSVNQPATITLSCSIEGAVMEPITYDWDFDGDGTVDSHEAEPVLSVIGKYEPTVTITDAAGKTAAGGYTVPIIVFSESGAVYVTSKENPNAKAPYATWETAATGLNEAMTYAASGVTVTLDDGVHYISSTIDVVKPMTICSTNGPAHTFFAKKSGTHQLFLLRSRGVVLDGFTVEGQGFGNYAGGAIMEMEYGTVRNCRFLRNTLVGHSSVYMKSGDGMVIENCEFSGNVADSQGPAGVRIEGTGSIVRNCLFVANTNKVVNSSSYHGGANIIGSASGKMINCTMVGNVSYNVGDAGVYNTGNGSVINCIVVGNLRRTNDEENAGQYVWLDSNDIGTNPAKQSHSLVWPTTYDYSAFTKVLTEDPQFKTNYTFSSSGPCVRTGLYQDWMKGATDYFGNPRATPGKHVDMGYWQSPDPGLMIRVR